VSGPKTRELWKPLSLLRARKRRNLALVPGGRGKAIYVILIVALVLRLGWGLNRSRDERALSQLPDQEQYLELGRNLIQSGELKFFDARFGQKIYAYRTPGYPAFVAMCGGNLVVIRVVQAVIDTSTVLGVYLLAASWLGSRGGVIAACLLAINPWFIYFSGLVLSETLFTAMLAWSILLLTRSTRLQILGCAILALSVLVRPSAVGLAILLPLSTVILNQRQAKPYHLPAVGVMALLLVLGPWAYRNKRVLGNWIWTTTNSGITQYDGFNPDADGSSDQRPFLEKMPQLKPMTEVQRDQYLSRQAREYVENESMGHLAWLTARKLARTWSPMPLSQSFGGGANVAIALAYTVPFFVLVVMGLIGTGRLSCGVKLLLMLPAIYFTIIHALSVGSLRYRVPADAPMAVLAAAGLARRSPAGLMNSEHV